MSDRFGYMSTEPCVVCGEVSVNNRTEPRFGYTVCEKHQDVPPAYLDIAKKEWVWFGETIWDKEPNIEDLKRDL